MEQAGKSTRGGTSAHTEWLSARRANGYRLLWVERGRLRPEAQHLIARLERASGDGLDPAAYDAPRLRRLIAAARSGEAGDVARAELALSTAASTYVSDLHRPTAAAAPAFRDPGLPAALDTPRAVLSRLFAARNTAAGLAAAQRMHPIYEALRGELARRGEADPLRPLILANMDRARALPATSSWTPPPSSSGSTRTGRSSTR